MLVLSSLRMGGVTNVRLVPVAADAEAGWAYYSTHVGSNGGLIEDRDLLEHPGDGSPDLPSRRHRGRPRRVPQNGCRGCRGSGRQRRPGA